MSGISVSEDAVNLFYYMKAKSTVRPPLAPGLPFLPSLPSCRTHCPQPAVRTSSHGSSTWHIAEGSICACLCSQMLICIFCTRSIDGRCGGSMMLARR